MNILSKFKFHPSFLFLGLSCVMASLFKEFLVISSLVLIHELGHIIVANFFKWELDNVTIYPFGGITSFKVSLNKPLVEEFFVATAGIIMQIIFYLLMLLIYHQGLMRSEVFALFTNYHYLLLWFNLLPIFSLDGSKIISVLLYKFLPFKLVYRFLIVISYPLLLVLIIKAPYNINIYLMCFLLLSKCFLENGKIVSIFNKFLLERHLHEYPFKKHKVIANLDEMMRGYKHIIKKDKFYYTEAEILKKRFDINNKI